MAELLTFLKGITPMDTATRTFVVVLFGVLLLCIVDGIRGK